MTLCVCPLSLSLSLAFTVSQRVRVPRFPSHQQPSCCCCRRDAPFRPSGRTRCSPSLARSLAPCVPRLAFPPLPLALQEDACSCCVSELLNFFPCCSLALSCLRHLPLFARSFALSPSCLPLPVARRRQPDARSTHTQAHLRTRVRERACLVPAFKSTPSFPVTQSLTTGPHRRASSTGLSLARSLVSSLAS